MRRFAFAPIYRACRACCVLALCCCASALLASCADRGYVTPSRPVAFTTSSDELSGPVLAEISPAYEACLDRCNEQSSLGALTREGCFKGCAESRRRVPLRDKVFDSRQECFDALYAVDLNRDLIIEDQQAWCKTQWSHLYKRLGCEDAVAVFYSRITAPEVCGGSSAPYAPSHPADAGVSPLGAAPAPVVQPVPILPAPSAPVAQPAPVPPVPPAPVVVPASEGGYLQDTPKYQARPVKKPARKKGSTPAKAAKPAQAVPKAPQKDAPAPDAKEKDAAASPPAATRPAPEQDGSRQTPPAKTTPPQTQAPAQPAAAPGAPAQPEPVTATATPAAQPQPEPATPTAAPAVQPQPVAPAPQQTPSAAPAPVSGPQQTPSAASAPEQAGSVDSVVPMPSMLERPYTAPPVISSSTPPPVPPPPPVE